MLRLFAVLPLSLTLLVAACASPAPEFMGASQTRISRDGRDYAVFHTATRAEVVRLGYAGRAERQGMLAVMIDVMAEATGCTPVVSSIEGDTGEIRGRIRCPKR